MGSAITMLPVPGVGGSVIFDRREVASNYGNLLRNRIPPNRSFIEIE